MNRKIIIGILVVLGTIGCIACCTHTNRQKDGKVLFVQQEGMPLEENLDVAEPEDTNEKILCVYICGEVKHAGVYELAQGARVSEVVDAAGGFTKKADTEAVNLARIAVDAEQIVIPRKTGKARKSKDDMSGSASEMQSCVNINTAEEGTLMTLTGIGKAKAEAIIDYRTQKGAFAGIEDIKQVPGIKDGIYEQIKDHICV